MDAQALKKLLEGTDESTLEVLKSFNAKHQKSFSFPELQDNKKQVLEAIVCVLDRKDALPTVYAECLQAIRIISREKVGLDNITSESAIGSMVRHAGLEAYAKENTGECFTIHEGNANVIVEASKCLCNIIFNSSAAQRICSSNGCVEGIVQRLKTYRDPELSHDIKFFDMRMLFLLTALCADIRPKIRHDLHGFTYLIEVLDLCLREAEEQKAPLCDQSVELCCEVLKILFNITVSLDKNNLDEEEEAHFMRLVSVLYDLLVCQTASKDKMEELQSHTVNLLTNMPWASYEELLTPVNEGAAGGNDNKDVEFDGRNMEAIYVLLDFLNQRLDTPKQSIKERLTPILHCLCEICRANASVRKFCRIKVLPYMRDEVKRLPEEGNTFRNKLCKLFTSPVTEVKDLSADFLFVLCKENVARFVKYTGYGNAAGLLAQRGLMCGGRGQLGFYSSESDDSDTEEYNELKEKINPVTGRAEDTPPNPLEGMSEEQKEYEAMQLVQELDKLTRGGIIQPTRIGEDGKPHPVTHVLELAEGMNIPDSQADTGAD